MAVNEKISKALKSATTHVDKSMQALKKDKEDLIDDGVWHASADLEYALFLFSITVEGQVDKSKWNPNPKFKKGEINPPLVKAKDLLIEAKKYLEEKELLDAYKNASIARSHLLKLQKYFTKKKREETKNKEKDRIDFSSL